MPNYRSARWALSMHGVHPNQQTHVLNTLVAPYFVGLHSATSASMITELLTQEGALVGGQPLLASAALLTPLCCVACSG